MLKTNAQKARLFVGIDEAGRGPLAGPVAVGMASYDPADAELAAALAKLFPIVKDSKQLSEAQREVIYAELVTLSKTTSLRLQVALTAVSVIDRHGITHAIKKGIERVTKSIDPDACLILLDGGLRAPKQFVLQETHVRGDATHLPIALASIAAKVRRDRHMRALAKRFPQYGFETHKGYGTKAHYKALEREGISSIHRKSFLQNILT